MELPFAIAVATDPQCHNLVANRVYAEILGVPQPGNVSLTGPEDERPQVIIRRKGQVVPIESLPVRRAISTGAPVRDDELEVVRPDQSVRYLLGHANPVLDAEGRVCGGIGVFMDITERKRAEDLILSQRSALFASLHMLAGDYDLDSYLDQVLTSMVASLEAMSAAMWLTDCDARTVTLRSTVNADGIRTYPPATGGAEVRFRMDEIPGWDRLSTSDAPVLVDLASWRSRGFGTGFLDWLAGQGVSELLMVPMLLSGQCIGHIGVRFEVHRDLSADLTDFALALAEHAGLAIQLTRLAAQRREAALLAERTRIAREIHDTIAQGLTGIIMHLAAARQAFDNDAVAAKTHLADAAGAARMSLAEARASVWAIRPPALGESTLPEAIRRVARSLLSPTRIQSSVRLSGTQRRLAEEIEIDILRIAQEAMTNAVKHADASRILITLSYRKKSVQLIVQDDGHGFPENGDLHENGFGLIGMRERVDRRHGQLDLKSNGSGTTVTVTVPVPAA